MFGVLESQMLLFVNFAIQRILWETDMAILNIGSVNWDRVFHGEHFPTPGETIAATHVEVGLGGKGLNHSVAIGRSAGAVSHLGAVGAADRDILNRISALGLATDTILPLADCETGSAQILIDASGENMIVLDRGANHHIPPEAMQSAIGRLAPGRDWLLLVRHQMIWNKSV